MSEEKPFNITISREVKELLVGLSLEWSIGYVDTAALQADGTFSVKISEKFHKYLVDNEIDPDTMLREVYELPPRGA